MEPIQFKTLLADLLNHRVGSNSRDWLEDCGGVDMVTSKISFVVSSSLEFWSLPAGVNTHEADAVSPF